MTHSCTDTNAFRTPVHSKTKPYDWHANATKARRGSGRHGALDHAALAHGDFAGSQPARTRAHQTDPVVGNGVSSGGLLFELLFARHLAATVGAVRHHALSHRLRLAVVWRQKRRLVRLSGEIDLAGGADGGLRFSNAARIRRSGIAPRQPLGAATGQPQ